MEVSPRFVVRYRDGIASVGGSTSRPPRLPPRSSLGFGGKALKQSDFSKAATKAAISARKVTAIWAGQFEGRPNFVGPIEAAGIVVAQ